MRKQQVGILVAGLATIALTSGGLKAWAEQDEPEGKEVKVSLSVEEFIASIRTAVAAKPGRVQSVEAESEDGKTLCDVTVLAADGKTYEVAVDVASNKVTEVEAAGDEKDDDKEDGDKDKE